MLKRISWRLHWTFSESPYLVSFADQLKINIPKSGSASLIYYQGFSEPDTADFVSRFLRKGMTFVDVGAHIGEYTLLAAKLVGQSGSIHGFEPQEALFPLLKENIKINHFNNVNLNQIAVSEKVGEVEFEVFDEPSVSSIRKSRPEEDKKRNSRFVSVSTTSLDHYVNNLESTCSIDLIKIDVEGAEKFVFEGAKELMKLPPSQSPTWIFEYAPKAYLLFDYQAQDLLNLLNSYDYQVYQYLGNGQIAEFSTHKSYRGIINMIATKNKGQLLAQINHNL
ncbi:MAG: FkbM family methyltransferase [Leptolyngbya sp. SIO3F4]|nr:FkbM family methyltransferase [Leptolyngbya sp. SIO3F4]